MMLLAAAMLFLGGVQIKWFALGGAAVAVFMFVYLKTQGYAGSRITAWRDPPPTRQTTAIRSYSRSTPSVPAA